MKYKGLFYLFISLAIALSNIMCAVVAYNYCAMEWGGRYAGYSAPASIAFFLILPYGAGIAICAALAWIFYRKYRKAG